MNDEDESTIYDVNKITKLLDINQIKLMINQLVNPNIKVYRNPSNLLEESPAANTFKDNNSQMKIVIMQD